MIILDPVFNEEEHEYLDHDGKTYRSVTQIIKDYWPVDTAWYTEGSRNKGSEVHRRLDLIDSGVVSAASQSTWEHFGYIEAWELFKESEGFKVTRSEQPFIDTDLGYAGTVDRVGTKQQKTLLIDIKTGAPADWHELQQAAYAAAMIKAEIPVNGIATVFLKENGKYQFRENSLPRGSVGWTGLMSWVRYRGLWQ